MEKFPTRKQYVNGEISHHDYYLSIAKTAGIGVPKHIMKQAVVQLANGDEHLNGIPLAAWDMLTTPPSPFLVSAFKKHEDNYCLAGGVCAYKVLAIEKAKDHK